MAILPIVVLDSPYLYVATHISTYGLKHRIILVRHCSQPTAQACVQWKRTFRDYLELLPFSCSGQTLTPKIKFKLLRLRLGENGQQYVD